MNSDYSNNFNQFSSSSNVDGNREFLNSNSLIAKFAFLLLVIVLFVIALRLGSSIFSWIFSPSPNPILINGMVDSKQMLVIQQDPSIKGSIPIMRSVNDAQGMEFTWSVWMYIDDFTYKQNEYKHVFHKGNDDINVTNPPIGLNYPNNAPGLYITPDTNDLIVIMNTFDTINETVLIKDIPLNKWINVIIRLNNQHQLDIYINGTLTKRHMLKGVAKQNYGNVYVSMNGGFSGYTSELRYFGSAIGTNKIQDIVNKGPNMNMNSADLTKTKPHYLSTRWYFAGSNDEYNP
jgi:hypothetical protein|tara:strand:- start:3689 stop:4558 length:870 start_codon:yes stop_codon:yes gene_type:complete